MITDVFSITSGFLTFRLKKCLSGHFAALIYDASEGSAIAVPMSKKAFELMATCIQSELKQGDEMGLTDEEREVIELLKGIECCCRQGDKILENNKDLDFSYICERVEELREELQKQIGKRLCDQCEECYEEEEDDEDEDENA